MRLFFAIALPQAVLHDFSSLAMPVSHVRWIPPTNIHLTVQFIGTVEESVAEQIQRAVRSLQLPSFQMRLSGVGAFPSIERPSVLWVGVDADAGLFTLQRDIFSRLDSLQLNLEQRPFRPHITVARIQRGKRADVTDWIRIHEHYGTDPIRVEAYQLFSSELRPSGAIYRQVAKYSLIG